MHASPRGAQTAVEGLDVAVLLRLSGVDVMPIDLLVVGPLQDGLAGELGAIVRGYAGRFSIDPDERVQFLRHALAFEMQCAALGAPKARNVTDLQRIVAGRPAAASVGARLQPGARLIREWQGRTWTVEVTETGFVMSGERFASLSAIAKRITGAHWSGPRFFGLKAGAAQQRSNDASTPIQSSARAVSP